MFLTLLSLYLGAPWTSAKYLSLHSIQELDLNEDRDSKLFLTEMEHEIIFRLQGLTFILVFHWSLLFCPLWVQSCVLDL